MNSDAVIIGNELHVIFFVVECCLVSFFSFADCSVIRFGRRIPYCTFMLIGGMAGLLVLAVPNKPGACNTIRYNLPIIIPVYGTKMMTMVLTKIMQKLNVAYHTLNILCSFYLFIYLF